MPTFVSTRNLSVAVWMMTMMMMMTMARAMEGDSVQKLFHFSFYESVSRYLPLQGLYSPPPPLRYRQQQRGKYLYGGRGGK